MFTNKFRLDWQSLYKTASLISQYLVEWKKYKFKIINLELSGSLYAPQTDRTTCKQNYCTSPATPLKQKYLKSWAGNPAFLMLGKCSAVHVHQIYRPSVSIWQLQKIQAGKRFSSINTIELLFPLATDQSSAEEKPIAKAGKSTELGFQKCSAFV